MSIITLLTDFGTQDHYTAALKASILRVNPSLRLIDISHQVPCGNVAQASFILRNVFKDFDTGTVHLVSVGADTVEKQAHVAVTIEGHHFVGPDNGLFSLLSPQQPTVIIDISNLPKAAGTFVAKNKYGRACAMLASGHAIYDLGSPCKKIEQLTAKQGQQKDNELHGHVIHVDATGNLIINLLQEDFEKKLQQYTTFELFLGGECLNKIYKDYHSVEVGELFVLFNSLGLLEIGIRYGHAANLLSINYDAPIAIFFHDAKKMPNPPANATPDTA